MPQDCAALALGGLIFFSVARTGLFWTCAEPRVGNLEVVLLLLFLPSKACTEPRPPLLFVPPC